MYAKNEIMFPPYVIPALREYRGAEWQRLVDRVLSLEEDHPEARLLAQARERHHGRQRGRGYEPEQDEAHQYQVHAQV